MYTLGRHCEVILAGFALVCFAWYTIVGGVDFGVDINKTEIKKYEPSIIRSR